MSLKFNMELFILWTPCGRWEVTEVKNWKVLETERPPTFLTIQYFWYVIQADSVWILKLQV